MDKPSSLASFALCVSVRPDRDEDGARPCSTPCAICRAGAVAVLRVSVDQVVPDIGAVTAELQNVRERFLDIVTELESP